VLAHAVREVNTLHPKTEETHALGALQSIDTIWDALFLGRCGTSLPAIASHTVIGCPRYKHKGTTSRLARSLGLMVMRPGLSAFSFLIQTPDQWSVSIFCLPKHHFDKSAFRLVHLRKA
jgi:hypothetical protein